MKGVEVAVTRSRKSSVVSTASKQSVKSKKSKEPLQDNLNILLRQNQQRKEDFKKMKKERKRAGNFTFTVVES